MDNDETLPVDGYGCITEFKQEEVRALGVAIYEKNNATPMTTPHLLMKLDKQNMAKTSCTLTASES
jgi:hypothetical protein